MSASQPNEKRKYRPDIVEFAKFLPVDVQIGAVEIKDYDSSARANVGESAKANALAVTLATDDAVYNRIGEVQASPTANTLLGRLKEINDWDESDRAKVNLIAGQAGITAGAGAVSTNTPRVTHASDDPVTVAVQIMDDWDESDRAKVNLIPGQAGITAGAGAVSTNTPRTTLASDDPAVTALQIIDDWDESDRAKVNPIAGQAGVAGGAGVTDATTQRVVLASDDAAVTALQIIDDWDESDRAKVNIIAGQAGVTAGAGAVAANTPRFTLASDDPAVALLGTINTGINTTLAGYVDGLEALITTLNSQTDTLEAKGTGPTTGTLSSVAASASDTTILASNASRKGATVYNDSSVVLYLALANTTSSTTAYSVQIAANGYYELPVNQGGVYTGVLKGIWASATGNARVTELT